MSRPERLRPLGMAGTIVAWAIPAGLLYAAHYGFVPRLVESAGWAYLPAYLLAYVATMALFLAAALVAYRIEGQPQTLSAFRERYRLRRMNRGDWLWSLGLLLLIALGFASLQFTTRWLAQWPLFAPHPVFAPEFGPAGAGAREPGTFMGMAITGVRWVAVVYLFGWFFNIAGEELWFRGYLMPRQEMSFGRRAWIANGLMFALTHVWQPWNLLVILPTALVGAYVVQRRKNTWVLIVPHGLANASLLVIIFLNALGIVA